MTEHGVDRSRSSLQAAEGGGEATPAMYQAADSSAGKPAGRAHGAVVAAVDDDANPPAVLAYAAAEARRRRVPLRVVHVWADSGSCAAGLRMCRHDRMSDADRLLSTVIYDHLPADEAATAERQILNDDDPVAALLALTADASLLVVGANSGSTSTGPAALGETVRALVGHTGCPLAVLPTSTP